VISPAATRATTASDSTCARGAAMAGADRMRRAARRRARTEQKWVSSAPYDRERKGEGDVGRRSSFTYRGGLCNRFHMRRNIRPRHQTSRVVGRHLVRPDYIGLRLI